TFSLGCHNIKPTPDIKPEKEVVTVIDHYVKHDTDLKCKDVAKVTNKGFEFYACESDLNQELISEFEFIADVKSLGMKTFDLVKSKNYMVYKNKINENPKTNYWLYVTGKFFIPQKRDNYIFIKEEGWHVDDIDKYALLISKVDDLKDEKYYYYRRGYDVFYRKITDFAGNCDITPEFIKRKLLHKVNTILHEDLHMTVLKKDWNPNLEESVACLIGNIGTIQYAKEHFGENSKEYVLSKLNLQFKLDLAEHLIFLNKQLIGLYSKKLNYEEKLKKKKEIFKNSSFMKNNADLWDSIPYNKNFPLLYKVHKKYSDIEELIKILNKIPKEEKEGIEYLKKIISEDTP
ncbi:MAG: hypothetical protein KKF52_03245, partial [Nanoarchaeota archaeon]|nr:hypothetical protein [Nanoarchaeota archaeon]